MSTRRKVVLPPERAGMVDACWDGRRVRVWSLHRDSDTERSGDSSTSRPSAALDTSLPFDI